MDKDFSLAIARKVCLRNERGKRGVIPVFLARTHTRVISRFLFSSAYNCEALACFRLTFL